MCGAAPLAQATAGSGAITGTVRDSYGDGIPDGESDTFALQVGQTLSFKVNFQLATGVDTDATPRE